MDEDRSYARALVAETREGEYALLINGLERTPANVYWFTGLRPPWPYLSIDQPSYCFRRAQQGVVAGGDHESQDGDRGVDSGGPGVLSGADDAVPAGGSGAGDPGTARGV